MRSVKVYRVKLNLTKYTNKCIPLMALFYSMTPIGVTLPKNADDVSAIIDICNRNNTAILPRGGGTVYLANCKFSRRNRFFKIHAQCIRNKS